MTDREPDTETDVSSDRTLAAGEVIFREGDPSDCAYVVVEGSVTISKDMESGPVALTELAPGDVFGELGLLDGSPRSATATAKGPVTLRRIEREAFLEKIQGDQSFFLPVAERLAGQVRDISDRVAHQQFLNIKRAASESAAPNKRSAFGPGGGFFSSEADIIAFQPDAIEIERRPAPKAATLMLIVILALLAATATWATLAHIDTVVVAPGRVATKVSNIVVQPIETAIIREVLVEEGDAVEKGQVLATLDSTFAAADVTASRAALTRIEAQEQRLMAELRGETLVSSADESAVFVLQQEVFDRRRLELEARLAALDERINQLESSIEANKQDAIDMAAQVEVLRELEEMRSTLLEKGHASRVNYLMTKHQLLTEIREQRKLISTTAQQEFELLAAKADRKAIVGEWRSKVAQELVDVRQKRDNLVEQLKKMERRETLVQLTAPANGVVLEVAERSVGSVIQQAEPMFTLVPTDVPLEMEADINTSDVAQVQLGDQVRIKLDALPFQKHGMLEGVVTYLSEDTIEIAGEAGPRPAYRSKIELTQTELRDVPQTFRLMPGITGNAEIKVGKRRLITYFAYPILRTIDTSFREP
ncbi:MAG: HlyD family type I secretion periplasmic adaptor subunit [Alphaproteobacteria bacterium]|nr:HlyD family type I secretion periplasmic adaptor subunit [Alphaproteobacteria bacterium]